MNPQDMGYKPPSLCHMNRFDWGWGQDWLFHVQRWVAFQLIARISKASRLRSNRPAKRPLTTPWEALRTQKKTTSLVPSPALLLFDLDLYAHFQRAPNPPKLAQPGVSHSEWVKRVVTPTEQKVANLGVFVPAWLVLTSVWGCKFGCVRSVSTQQMGLCELFQPGFSLVSEVFSLVFPSVLVGSAGRENPQQFGSFLLGKEVTEPSSNGRPTKKNYNSKTRGRWLPAMAYKGEAANCQSLCSARGASNHGFPAKWLRETKIELLH